MKKIFLIVASALFISCSDNGNNSTNALQTKITGNWKYVGYYDDQGNEPDGTNFHPFSNGDVIIYYSNNSFAKINTINGNYSISNDSILTTNFTSTINAETYTGINKIFILNDNELELGNYNGSDIIGISRYEKVTLP